MRTSARQIAAAMIATLGFVIACGPDFPNRLLLSGDSAVLSAPNADFRRELEAITARPISSFKSNVPGDNSGPYEQSIEIDIRELKEAMGSAASEELIAEYARWRRAATLPGAALPSPNALPSGLPVEFQLYAQGFLLYRQQQPAEARAVFSRLLSLPAGERSHRTVWAAFMTGKTCLGGDPESAVQWFRRTREFAKDGFSDRLGLAASSLGWEARAELDRGNYRVALALYLEQLSSGDPTAFNSLRVTVAQLMGAAGAAQSLEMYARDPIAQRIITAHLVSRGVAESGGSSRDPGPFRAAWLSALEASGAADLSAADRLAWAAYQHGDNAAARRWLKLSPPTPIAKWIQAKLLLRDGKPDDAAKLLADVSNAFPADESWSVKASFEFYPQDASPSRLALGESGVILLARRHYTEALDALLRAGYWQDSAYVAERVLTVQELKAYVDVAWPALAATQAAPPDGDSWTNTTSHSQATELLRHLLGRRLARAGRLAEARPYFPRALLPAFDTLAAAHARFAEPGLNQDSRAAALWKVAEATREHGLDLIATELAPDFAIYNGNFELYDDGNVRHRMKAIFVPQSDDEITRSRRSAPSPDSRYHYRYVAADYAWRAAALMPDDDDQTAYVLYRAGGWLKAKDPDAANRFYKALVHRCGNTALGAAAKKARWFPRAQNE